MKKLIVSLFLLSISPSLAQKTMLPLKEYKNKKNDVYAEGHVFIRCAALNFYIGILYKNDKSISENSNKNFEYFKSKSFKHLQTKLRMSENETKSYFVKNWENFARNYFEDGEENYKKTNKFITNYIAEDLEICNKI